MDYTIVLTNLRALYKEKLATLQGLYAGAEQRSLTEVELATFADLRNQLDSLQAQIDNTVTLIELSAGNSETSGVEVGDNAEIQVVRNLPVGTSFTRYAMALASAKGNLMQALETSKQWEGSTPEVARVLRAAVAAGTTTDATWAAPLIEYRTMAEEFIELLRPATILGQLNGVRRVPFNIRIPRQTAGAAVGWVGEGAPKPVNRQSFDTVTMPESKIAGIVVITMELARFANPAAEAVVRQDMVDAIAEFSDAQFINPGIAPVANVSPGSITNGAPAAASAGTTLANIETDLRRARQGLINARIPLAGAVWVMDPSTRLGLEEMRTAQDVLAYPTLAANGTLKGLPVIESLSLGMYDQDGPFIPGSVGPPAVPDQGTGVARKYLALVSAPDVLLADDGQVMLDASSEASLVMDDAPPGTGGTFTSLWQRNMIGIRAERLIHWMRRRAAGVFVIYNVLY